MLNPACGVRLSQVNNNNVFTKHSAFGWKGSFHLSLFEDNKVEPCPLAQAFGWLLLLLQTWEEEQALCTEQSAEQKPS